MFCKCKLHGHAGAEPDWNLPDGDFDYGLTFFRSLLAKHWVGTPTSALSARRFLLARFLPCALEAHWRIQADAVLCHGASLALGRKFQIGDALVRYHVHGANNWFHQDADRAAQLATLLKIHQLVARLANFHPADRSTNLILREFRTIPRPRYGDARRYASMIRQQGGCFGLRHQLLVWFEWARRRRGAPPQPLAWSPPSVEMKVSALGVFPVGTPGIHSN